MSQQQTKNSITLRGSAQIICEYLKYAINSVLFQRGLYPPETFKAEQQYGITLLMSDDAQIKSFLTNLLTQSEGVTDSPLCRACMEEEETAAHVILACPGVAEYRAKHLGTPGSLPEAVGNVKGLLGFLVELEWIIKKNVSKLSLVILNVANKEVLECWDFNVQYEDGDAALSKEKNEPISSKELKKIQQEIRDVMLQVAATISYLPFLDCRCSFDVLVHAKTDCDVPEKWAEAEPVAIQNAQNVQFKAFSTGLNKVETVVSYKLVD